MKVRPSVRKICEKCKIVRRKGVVETVQGVGTLEEITERIKKAIGVE